MKRIAAGVGLFCALLAWCWFALAGHRSSADEWHQHGPEKISSVVLRMVGSDSSIRWQAGADPVVDTDALWRNAVLMNAPDSSDGPYVTVNRFFVDVSHVNPAWAFAACWNQTNVLTIVPVDRALDTACRGSPDRDLSTYEKARTVSA
jgi:hypothetical protein